MTAGDPVNDCDSIAAGASVDFTPAATKQYKITCLTAGSTSGGQDQLKFSQIFGGVECRFNSGADALPSIALFLDSNTSLRRTNVGPGGSTGGFSGIEIA